LQGVYIILKNTIKIIIRINQQAQPYTRKNRESIFFYRNAGASRQNIVIHGKIYPVQLFLKPGYWVGKIKQRGDGSKD
jgi:hypothetical protein